MSPIATYCTFMIGASMLFVGAFVGVVVLQEYWSAKDEQFLFEDIILTCILLYGYIRVTLQEGVYRIMTKYSRAFNDVPGHLKADTVFSLSDSCTAFFWLPMYVYVMTNLFRTAPDTSTFWRLYGPLAKVLIATYQVDRLLHLYALFGFLRFIHHASTAVLSLMVFWFFQSKSDLSVLTILAMEPFAKVVWYWASCGRLCLSIGIRSKNEGKWLPPQGIDRLFVPSNVSSATRIGKFVRVYAFFDMFGIPAMLLVAYMIIFRDEQSLFWQIATPCILVLFNLVDIPVYKYHFKGSKAEYWKNNVYVNMDTTEKVSSEADNREYPHGEVVDLEELQTTEFAA